MRVKSIHIGTIIISVVIFFTSCTKKTCPAYQSYFLLDEESQIQFFSYFEENEQEDEGTSATNIHQDPRPGQIDTSSTFGRNSQFTPRTDFPIEKSKKNAVGISSGPTIKTYKKRYYVVKMKDVYVAQDSLGEVSQLDTLGTIAPLDTTSSF